MNKDLGYWKKRLIDYLVESDRMGKAKSYPIGTIRTWNGKKFIKAPNNKWKRYYETASGRGVSQATRNTIKKIQAAKSLQDLVDIIRENRTRFVDENGRPSGVVMELISEAKKERGLRGEKVKTVASKLPSNKPTVDLYKKMIEMYSDAPGDQIEEMISTYKKNIRNSEKTIEALENQKETNPDAESGISYYRQGIENKNKMISALTEILQGRIKTEPSVFPDPTDEQRMYADMVLEDDLEDVPRDLLDMNNRYMDIAHLGKPESFPGEKEDLYLKIAARAKEIVESRGKEEPPVNVAGNEITNIENDVMGYLTNGDLDSMITRAESDKEFRTAMIKVLKEYKGELPDPILKYVIAAGDKSGRGKDKKKRKSPTRQSSMDSEGVDKKIEEDIYADTGYIAGSKKELAQERIKKMVEAGQNVGVDDIDWEAIEENPRLAQSLIKKSNIIGKVDWETLEADGMDPGAGFLIDRVYASIASEPDDNALSRKDYVRGIETLRDRLEGKKTYNEVLDAIHEMRLEFTGVKMSEDEVRKYDILRSEYRSAMLDENVRDREIFSMARSYKDLKHRYDLFSEMAKRYVNGSGGINYKEKADGLKLDVDERLVKLKFFMDNNPNVKSYKITGENVEFVTENSVRVEKTGNAMNQFKEEAMKRAWMSQDEARAWKAMGERFHNILLWRSGKSSAFKKNVENVVYRKKYKTWEWSKQSKNGGGTSKSKRFKLIVSDSYERIGGKPIDVKTTQELKDTFGLRDIQSGNYVLADKNSAKFHVENSAMAFQDLADITGIPVRKIGINGRLALAFGARGSGGARAHYEPTMRVINITKMKGGGSLAHEWFHAFDNLISEATTGKETGAGVMGTEDRSVDMGELRDAFNELTDNMTKGSEPLPILVKIDANSRSMAKLNLENPRHEFARQLKEAGSMDAAVEIVRSRYVGSSKSQLRDKNVWLKIAVAHYADPETNSYIVKAGPKTSRFLYESTMIDGGNTGRYWSKTLEMGARAFAGWTEDRLSKDGRKNDYLSNHASNKAYKFAKPYPEGEERDRIYASFDKIFELVSKNDSIRKSIFD